jgi:hypothetical protein
VVSFPYEPESHSLSPLSSEVEIREMTTTHEFWAQRNPKTEFIPSDPWEREFVRQLLEMEKPDHCEFLVCKKRLPHVTPQEQAAQRTPEARRINLKKPPTDFFTITFGQMVAPDLTKPLLAQPIFVIRPRTWCSKHVPKEAVLAEELPGRFSEK